MKIKIASFFSYYINICIILGGFRQDVSYYFQPHIVMDFVILLSCVCCLLYQKVVMIETERNILFWL